MADGAGSVGIDAHAGLPLVAVDARAGILAALLPDDRAGGRRAAAAAAADIAAAARRLADMLEAAAALDCYNKVVVRVDGETVDIVLAAGEKLLLCNAFPAADPVSAQYYLFAVLRQFQINPEVTTVHFFGEADDTIKADLFRHFASVEML